MVAGGLADILTLGIVALLALVLAAGLVIFAIECVRASRRRPSARPVNTSHPWPTAAEVVDPRRRAGL